MEKEYDLDMDYVAGLTIGFGGGFGRRGLVCGALSGGAMAIGHRYWHGGSLGNRDVVYNRTLEMCRRFEESFGATSCRDLTGYDLTTEEGRRGFKSELTKEKKCCKYIGMVVDTLVEYFQADKEAGLGATSPSPENHEPQEQA